MLLNEDISVLIVDDSAIARGVLRGIFTGAGGFKVIGEASDGAEAVRQAKLLQPRLITLDIDMPGMNGLEAIEEIMSLAPTRILVITGLPRYAGLDATFEALSRGALDLLPKPSVQPVEGEGAMGTSEGLIRQARCLATVPVVPHFRRDAQARNSHREQQEIAQQHLPSNAAGIVVIGASTGGPSAVRALFQDFPKEFPMPVVLVQHLAGLFVDGFVEWLAGYTGLDVVTARGRMPLDPGKAYVVAGNVRAVIKSNQIEVTASDDGCSIDEVFSSAAVAYGNSVIGAILTGMGEDGAQGLKEISNAGGVALAQDEASCAVYGMPKAAVALGAVQISLPPPGIATRIMAVANAGHGKVK